MQAPRPITLVTHPDCDLHDPGRGHVESRRRIPAIVAALRADPELEAALVEHRAAAVSEEDLLRVHTPAHVARVRAAAERAARRRRRIWLDDDTAVSAGSWNAALAAAGCVVTAAEAVVSGAAGAACALARPPGHHATADRAMGFCLFNNVAVAVRRVQALERVGRVLVIDWDAHHANGTQDVFYDDPSVYVLSVHQSPGYPDSGAADEVGAGAGRGTTRNVPLPPGTTAVEYRRQYLEALDAILAGFAPELVIVSAGFDCLAGDPEGGLLLEPADLHRLTLDLLERLPATAGGRVVAALEGGYAPQRIGSGLVQVARALAGLPPAARGLP